MQATESTQGLDLQYAVIGRLNKGHSAHALTTQEIKQLIVNELCVDVDAGRIIHVPPNYIIQLKDGHAQAHVLAAHPLLHTNYFLLEILPWSKEHEWCQLPWISAYGSETSDIPIDPLKILPIISSKTKQTGAPKLKDTFGAMIPRNYELRAPDFSYLLITELKDFYYTKSSIFRTYRELFTSLQSATHDLYPIIHNQVSTICAYIQSLQSPSMIESVPHVHTFANEIRKSDMAMNKGIANIDHLAEELCSDTGNPIDLQGFKDGPSSSKVAVPPRYADRLKAIFIAAIERLQNTTPIIETIQVEDKFETYITVSNFTRRYYGSHEKTADAMEAAAMFYWLKQISNVQSYRVFDLNYPKLAEIVTTIDRWNAQINILEFLIDLLLKQTKNMHKDISKDYKDIDFQEVSANHSQRINAETYKLLDILEEHCSKIRTISHKARSYKVKYISTKIGLYSPSRSYYRLGRAKRPILPGPAP